jgi:NAD(P)-dependent dehydrogenase (short-subunit alcohol dehydrogenase family)
MKLQKTGCIIFTSSVSGLFGVPNRSPYVAAKWGIVGLTKSMAMELGDYGVRVNAICPGAVSGPRMEKVLSIESDASGLTRDELRKVYSEGTAMRSFVSEDDVADMAVFLASDKASMITGQAIAVDGYTERTV